MVRMQLSLSNIIKVTPYLQIIHRMITAHNNDRVKIRIKKDAFLHLFQFQQTANKKNTQFKPIAYLYKIPIIHISKQISTQQLRYIDLKYLQITLQYFSDHMSSASLKVISRTPNSTIFCFGEGTNKMAIKTVPSHNLRLALHLRNEHSLLKKLHHPNIVRVFKYEQNLAASGNTTNSQSKQSRNSLVLEYADKGTLLHCIQHLHVTLLLRLFSQVCEGLNYLHARDICHRDIKLDNILVFQEGQEDLLAKICDFGFAALCKKGKKQVRFHQFKGTKEGFMAPQIFAARTNPQLDYDGKKADIFAMGVIIFALVFKKLPFEQANTQNRLYKLLIDQKHSEFWSEHCIQRKQLQLGNLDEFKVLFETMVNFLPKERPQFVDQGNGRIDKTSGNTSTHLKPTALINPPMIQVHFMLSHTSPISHIISLGLSTLIQLFCSVIFCQVVNLYFT